MFSVNADSDNQPYLVLTMLDGKEHAAGATVIDIAVTYQASPGHYDFSRCGWIGLSAYHSSAGANDVTNLPLFGTSDRIQATSHAANGFAMTQVAAAGYQDSATRGARSGLAAKEPTHGSPGSVAAGSASVRGQAPSCGAQPSNDRLLPGWAGIDATSETVGGMTVVPALSSDLRAPATDSIGLPGSDTSLGTSVPGDRPESQQADTPQFDQNGRGNITSVTNFNTAKGDKIALDTNGSTILSGNTYDLGGAAITLGTDLANVANVAARLGTTLSNGGKGAFVYEQDTGELFYSGNGSFAGGVVQIGIVTAYGSTPWTFNANSFMQV